MVAQDCARRAEAQLLSRATAQFFAERLQPLEKRANETEQFFARGCQMKRAALKERDAERFLELQDLRADRGLLDAVRDVPDRLADAFMPGDIEEQLQMMDVHTINSRNGTANNINSPRRSKERYKQPRESSHVLKISGN